MRKPRFPSGTRVLLDNLIDGADFSRLGEDIFTAELPDGPILDVGWDRRSRSFAVRVFREHPFDSLEAPKFSPNIDDAVKCIEVLAQKYSTPTSYFEFAGFVRTISAGSLSRYATLSAGDFDRGDSITQAAAAG